MSLPVLLLVAAGSLLQGCGDAPTPPPPRPAPAAQTEWSTATFQGADGEVSFGFLAQEGQPMTARCSMGGRTSTLSLPSSWLASGTVELTTANVDDEPDPELIAVVPVMTGMGPQGAIPTRTPMVLDCTATGVRRLTDVEDRIGVDPDRAAIDAVVQQ
ncbi:MAG: hypothetical protein H6742_12145 [Alphaproteobacteria bacterium]|nr:hypothetical protein [Alphaproteobacteria bacterium]